MAFTSEARIHRPSAILHCASFLLKNAMLDCKLTDINFYFLYINELSAINTLKHIQFLENYPFCAVPGKSSKVFHKNIRQDRKFCIP